MQRVLPHEDVKAKIADLAIGLAANCDSPESAVAQIMRANLPGASTLPFVAFITHDGKWIDGFSGHKTAGAFAVVLDKVEKSPLLQASEATRKKLAALVARARKAAAKGSWKSVVKAGQAAAKLKGRCPERKQMAKLMRSASRWARGQLYEAAKLAQAADNLGVPRKTLMDVKKKFAGQPEADDAANGLKALRAMAKIVKAESGGKDAAASREKAADTFKGTRWVAIFNPDTKIERDKEGPEADDDEEDESGESEFEMGDE